MDVREFRRYMARGLDGAWELLATAERASVRPAPAVQLGRGTECAPHGTSRALSRVRSLNDATKHACTALLHRAIAHDVAPSLSPRPS